eukprot:gene14678-31210_t
MCRVLLASGYTKSNDYTNLLKIIAELPLDEELQEIIPASSQTFTSPTGAPHAWTSQDKAICDLLYSTNINSLVTQNIMKGWKCATDYTATGLCKDVVWSGVICSGTTVVDLQLSYGALGTHSISGTIPKSIGFLTELTRLSLSFESFTGTIPLLIRTLTKLNYLQLSNNQITGTIPTGIGALTLVSILDLSHTKLTGTV